MSRHAVMAMAGEAGESTIFGGNGVRSPSPELLFSLGTALVPLRTLLSLSPVSEAISLGWPDSSTLSGLGDRQVGSCQTMPVKLFSCNGFFSHLRQGAPERSKARRPALMAPVLALGPGRGPTGPGLT